MYRQDDRVGKDGETNILADYALAVLVSLCLLTDLRVAFPEEDDRGFEITVSDFFVNL